DERLLLRVVHGVGQVAHQHATDAPARHLLDGETAAQHAHVGVDAYDEQVGDAAGLHQAVDLGAGIGDEVAVGDLDGSVLPGPGLEGLLRLLVVAAAVAVVDG